MARGTEWCPEGWDRHTYPHGDHSHPYYIVDRSPADSPHPSVLLMHEFPGISDNLVALANVLAEDFRVVVPSIVGRDGSATPLDSMRQICVRREVHILARHGVSASVAWLREFADAHVADSSGRRYGVIGLCLTGNFALALAVDPRVAAAVVGEPAIPVRPSGLGLSPGDSASLAEHPDLRVQGYRFRYDCLSPGAKLDAAQRLLGGRMQVFTLTGPNQFGHSTLTGRWRSDAAIASTRAFLNERLAP
ncbi:dienelactone hydrolase family protein [Microbacterium pumilum]|uniref:Dienelactone hydrolase domain-containing protein n=1 Tax=Microbacterium pumilum TaxID=344165 RepID=A0ABN2S1L9_9MICO